MIQHDEFFQYTYFAIGSMGLQCTAYKKSLDIKFNYVMYSRAENATSCVPFFRKRKHLSLNRSEDTARLEHALDYFSRRS